ncbi:MAG: carbohydrate ABC transporter permease [Thermodesulfobacteriota bacterium]
MPKPGRILKWLGLGAFSLWTILPIVFMISASFKGTGDIFKLPPPGDWWGILKLLFWFDASLVQFESIFHEGFFFSHLLTSIAATGLSVAISVPVGLAAAYALSRANIPGKKHLYFWVITTRMAPPIAVMIPLYVLWRSLGALHSLPGLVLAYITFNLPFAIWLLRGFMDSIPKELEEAAYVDGKGRVGAFVEIILPLIRPGVGATVILCSMFAWNDYLFALILGGRGAKTLPVGISELASATQIHWGQIMAGGLVMIIPMVVLGLAIRKSLVTGLTMGAMRG